MNTAFAGAFPRPGTEEGAVSARWVALLLPLALAFWVFAYNSGYGYDQLEYLVIGRAWARGIPFYTYIPSKSFGIFALVALLLDCGIPLGHASLSAVVAAVHVVLVVVTCVVVNATSGRRAALCAAALVGACSYLMELNFLQPTGFVYLSGIVAFPLVLRAVRAAKEQQRALALAAAGAVLGIGFMFKATASLYLAAVCLYQLVEGQGRTWRRVAGAATVVAGFGLVVGICAAMFALTGQLAAFWRWTVTFPLFDYPANTYYFAKLYTKLLGIHLLFVAAALGSLLPSVRAKVYGDPAAKLALVLGGVGYLQLLKTQASHYCFPGAAFLCVFTALVLARLTRRAAFAAWRVAMAAGIVAVLFAGGVLYRPGAVRRFTTLTDFEVEEKAIAGFVARHVPPGDNLVAFDRSTWVYWIADRLPPPPFINTDEKTTWQARREPHLFDDVLSAPRLRLVEFSPGLVARPALDDPGFGTAPGDGRVIAAVHERLVRDFQPLDTPSELRGFTFWTRLSGQTQGRRLW